ncbi:extracellular catalytic domain type 1 short-chain-length polyhydroxyalkanoate depolymerase [Noviherbaspirillum suwonense]|uniref:Esterase, PHB depolymerase family n=1 Tax=Noviherbaspirillum suwonense TaxID=1224511 RepID=A0ABY1PRW6_9BURK|nr:PHB depolymerase family esterase [Noviherbaspirillum suwonense]SMP40701.1 esterase, PHB depolymerase family [Noviherbaspirillum suwonense]
MNINENFIAQMRDAARLLQTEGPMAATAAVQRALHGAAPGGAASPFAQPAPADNVVDINPAFAETVKPQAAPRRAGIAGLAQRLRAGMGQPVVDDVEEVAASDAAPLKGKFLSLSCTAPAGTRAYKLYIPSTYAGEPAPLVVMLHGCKQNPDDFAAGTGMNALAEEQGCLVVYPAQAKNANGSNCWNWFQANDQRRDRGEPSIIAAITQQVMRDYKVDPERVYVAGLSAGGAMAAILASEYPDLYKAAGVHSGLPTGAAHDVPSAFAAMQDGAANGALKARSGAAIPVIVFHGDRDRTVHPQNGHQVLAHHAGPQPGAATTEKGSTPNGRSYTRAIHRNAGGKLTAEHWTVHGSGHAWSGGSKRGSYTDPKGPDASREMLRFFGEVGK